MSAKTKKPKADPYQETQASVMEALEGLPLIKGPSIIQYRDMLKEFQADVDAWFEASIAAATQDLKRTEDK